MNEMPVFIIKAKDKLSLRALAAYHLLCVEMELTNQAVEVFKAMIEMHEWQKDNADLMQMPDHKHVPVNLEISEDSSVRK